MIKTINLSKKYKKNTLYENVNITFESNKISFLLGKNGSGKTSLIKCIFDLEKYEGDILFDDGRASEVGKECFVVWDDAPFYIELTGLQNIEVLTENICSKSEINERAIKYLGMDVLKRKVKSYSYGQKKKLALIIVDILKPKYLVMDEISNGLDYESMCELKKQIKLWSKDMTIILTGHQFGFYNDIVDEVFVIKDKSITPRSKDFQNDKESLEEVYDEELLEIRD